MIGKFDYCPETYQVGHKATPLTYEVLVASKNTDLQPPNLHLRGTWPQWILNRERHILGKDQTELSLAYNAPTGKWELVIRDVASDKEARQPFVDE